MLLEIILLLLAIPTGFLVAHLAHDELKQGRKLFLVLMILSFLSAISFSIEQHKVEVFTSTFIFIFTSISYIKSLAKNLNKR